MINFIVSLIHNSTVFNLLQYRILSINDLQFCFRQLYFYVRKLFKKAYIKTYKIININNHREIETIFI